MCILIILSIKLFRIDTYLLNKSRDNHLNDHILGSDKNYILNFLVSFL
jgi:hypothetical protein